jgi:hypothetical protein
MLDAFIDKQLTRPEFSMIGVGQGRYIETLEGIGRKLVRMHNRPHSITQSDLDAKTGRARDYPAKIPFL